MSFVTYGKTDGRCVQGWMRRTGTSTWEYHWSDFWDTHERDGPITWKNNEWSSVNGRIRSCPRAVMDDFGNLVAVP